MTKKLLNNNYAEDAWVSLPNLITQIGFIVPNIQLVSLYNVAFIGFIITFPIVSTATTSGWFLHSGNNSNEITKKTSPISLPFP